MKGYIVVKFLLRHGHYFASAFPAETAKRIMDDWRLGKFGPLVSNFDYPPNPPDALRWTVRTEEIIAMHEMTLETAQQAYQPVRPGTQPHAAGKWSSGGLN